MLENVLSDALSYGCSSVSRTAQMEYVSQIWECFDGRFSLLTSLIGLSAVLNNLYSLFLF